MKNRLLLSLMAISLFALPNLSYAVLPNSDDTATKRETIQDKIEARKEAVKQNVASRTEEIKNNVAERRQNVASKMEERLIKFVSNVIERLNAAADRLDVLTQRINSRITKMEAKNIDVKEAKNLLVTAKAKIETAKASIALITLNTDPSTSSGQAASTTASTLKSAFGVTKLQIEKAKQDLKAAHAALVDVVNSLKPGKNATTTNEINN
jgi:hypothetical protein